MGGRKLQVPSRQKPPYLRRWTVLLLALTYLFVGLGHAAFHAKEALAATAVSEIGVAASGGSDEGDSTKAPVLAEHCSVYIPVMMPTPMLMTSPIEHPVKIVFTAPQRLLEDSPKLDTPPPKHLT
ncbi:MAG: hypothetical protein JSS22_08765 [Proteobacteria bacterium]|nr:hypothetical protein [Pseudomonadota bacterium]MCB1463345.1 hypothetical protein [Nitratireductor sp.]